MNMDTVVSTAMANWNSYSTSSENKVMKVTKTFPLLTGPLGEWQWLSAGVQA